MEYEPDTLSEFDAQSVVGGDSHAAPTYREVSSATIATPLLRRPKVRQCCGCLISPRRWCIYVTASAVFIVLLIVVFGVAFVVLAQAWDMWRT